MQKKQLKSGAVLSYMQMIINIILGLIYTPIMIRLLGQSEYGLYSTVSSTINMLFIFRLGFNSGYIKFYSKYKKINDETSIYKLNGLYIIVFSVLGLITFLCGLFLLCNIKLLYDNGLTPTEYSTAKTLMLLLIINIVISFPASTFTAIISANEKFAFLKTLAIAKTILVPIITLPLLIIGYKSIAVITVTLFISLFIDILYFIYVKKVLKNKFIFHEFEKGLFKDLFIFSIFIGISLIVDQLNTNMDKFLLGRFCGTTTVAIYSVGFSLFGYYILFSTAVSNVFTPKIHNIVNENIDDKEKNDKLTNLFIKVGRIQFIILTLISSGVVFFGLPFIYFWVGKGYENSYIVAVLLILSSTIFYIQHIGIEIQRALNKHKFSAFVNLIAALINLVLTIILSQKYGEIGATLGTCISFLVANGLIINIYYYKKCNINVFKFWKSIIRLCTGLIIPIILGIIINYVVNLYSIINLLGFILIYAIVYCASMWFIGMNKYEKNLILNMLMKLKSKATKKGL